MGKRHLEPWEIMRQCKRVARERRMCDRTPWTAAGIICGYTLLKSEGFKGKRISSVTNKINEMEADFDAGKIDIEKMRDDLDKKYGLYIWFDNETIKDLNVKKGSYAYWISERQIDPQNSINQITARYMIFFYTVLANEYGYGESRLTRVYDYSQKLLVDYADGKTELSDWRKELLEDAGVVFENPIDPLTQTGGY